MSFIKDYPCPRCGANLYKVGFCEVYPNVTLTVLHFYIGKHHKSSENYDIDETGYVICGQCYTKINMDLSEFMFMVNEEWA